MVRPMRPLVAFFLATAFLSIAFACEPSHDLAPKWSRSGVTAFRDPSETDTVVVPSCTDYDRIPVNHCPLVSLTDEQFEGAMDGVYDV